MLPQFKIWWNTLLGGEKVIAEIQKLISVYYDIISMDHHKTRDTYFNIETVMQPNEVVRYIANHAGYHNEIGEYGAGPERNTYDEALSDLLEALKGFIKKEQGFALRVLSEDDWDLVDKDMACQRIKILEEQAFEWL